ncbi:MAG: hypothetical protein COB37_03560 [Kordiimonadales bacterium]|nr:MAG: hypothetical protein COB37_03560 [Kordiimonadales bacterium]
MKMAKKNQMTSEDFEMCLSLYGSDCSAWPAEISESATKFAASAAGRDALLAEAALDKMFSAALAIGPETTSDGNCDMFLERLADIPLSAAQVLPEIAESGVFDRLVAFFSDTSRWLSPAALASQTAVFAAVLSLGVAVGATTTAGAGTNLITDNEMDISYSLFIVSDDLSLEDE